MENITKEQIKSLAKLAKLSFTEEELEKMVGEFGQIVAFADSINRMIEGDNSLLKEVGGRQVPLENLREDEVIPSLNSQKILSNVEEQNGYFAVKRVVK
jgi:aspartyl-tRNA(Asn)/glutamyl-tRNA(Gln) amidotransferase subunit C